MAAAGTRRRAAAAGRADATAGAKAPAAAAATEAALSLTGSAAQLLKQCLRLPDACLRRNGRSFQQKLAAISLEVHLRLHGPFSERSNDFVLNIQSRSALFYNDIDERVANRHAHTIKKVADGESYCRWRGAAAGGGERWQVEKSLSL